MHMYTSFLNVCLQQLKMYYLYWILWHYDIMACLYLYSEKTKKKSIFISVLLYNVQVIDEKH